MLWPFVLLLSIFGIALVPHAILYTMSGHSITSRRRSRSHGSGHTTSTNPRQTHVHVAERDAAGLPVDNSPPLQPSISQASTLYPGREQTSFNVEAPLGSFENPYPPGVTPSSFPDRVPIPPSITPSRPPALTEPQGTRRSSVPDDDRLPVRKRSQKKRIGDKLFPKIIDSGIEPGQFYRKRAGQRSASVPQRNSIISREQSSGPSLTGPGEIHQKLEIPDRRSLSLNTARDGAIERASYGYNIDFSIQETVDVSSTQQSAWGSSRIFHPDSDDAALPTPTPAIVDHTQTSQHGFQLGSRTRESRARNSSLSIPNDIAEWPRIRGTHLEPPTDTQPYFFVPFERNYFHGTTSYRPTSPPPVPPKEPLPTAQCIACADRPAAIMAEAGAFCDECWTAAYQTASSASSPAGADIWDTESAVDHITAENTRRNRQVSFSLPKSSVQEPA